MSHKNSSINDVLKLDKENKKSSSIIIFNGSISAPPRLTFYGPNMNLNSSRYISRKELKGDKFYVFENPYNKKIEKGLNIIKVGTDFIIDPKLENILLFKKDKQEYYWEINLPEDVTIEIPNKAFIRPIMYIDKFIAKERYHIDELINQLSKI